MRRILLLAVLAAVLADAAPRAAAADAAGPSQADVEAARARGVAWLRAEQDPRGSFGGEAGETALALLALRHSGLREDDRAAQRAALSLARDLPDGTTYGASLGAVALLGQEGARFRDEAEALAADLVRAQCVNGQWTYSTRRSSPSAQGDNSNAQLAVFALAAARARGIDVPKETFARAVTYLSASQNADGGWGYAAAQRRSSYASMTSGAVMAASLGGGADAAVKRGLAWLAAHSAAGENAGASEAFGARKGRRGDDVWAHYALWSLERAASVTGAERLGARDWYAEGARHLLASQQDDGSWRGPERAVQATSFALLFLARGSLAVVTPRRAPEAAVTPR